MIKLGTNNLSLQGIEKAYLGSDLVYQKANYAPYSCKALYHCDYNLTDETGINTATGTYNEQLGKFNRGTRINGIRFYFPLISIDDLKTKSYTLEFWCRKVNSTDKGFHIIVGSTGSTANGFLASNDYVTNGMKPSNSYSTGSSTLIYKPDSFDCTIYHHLAIVFHLGTIYCFIDGKLSTTTPVATNLTKDLDSLSNNWQVSSNDVDEVMFCEEAKYLADFTPPTRPYILRT